MFGSDWPVCGVGAGTNHGHQRARRGGESVDGQEKAQAHEENSEGGREVTRKTAWTEWHDVVEKLLEACELDEDEKEWVWWRTAAEAYGIEVDVGSGSRVSGP